MSGERAFSRARRLLHQSLEQSDRDSAGTEVDIDSIATTIAFVTSIASAPDETAADLFIGDTIPYTVTAASDLADRVRQQLHVGDVDPLFDLPSRLPNQLATLVFPIDSANVSSACAVFEKTTLIFVSTHLGTEQLPECARAFGNAMALSARSKRNDTAFIENLPATGRGIGPRAYFAANFSAHLLIPTRGLAVSLRKVRELLKVTKSEIGDIEILYAARIFGVSFADMVRRCERARLLPPGGARALEKFLIEKFGGAEERANQLGLPVLAAA